MENEETAPWKEIPVRRRSRKVNNSVPWTEVPEFQNIVCTKLNFHCSKRKHYITTILSFLKVFQTCVPTACHTSTCFHLLGQEKKKWGKNSCKSIPENDKFNNCT